MNTKNPFKIYEPFSGLDFGEHFNGSGYTFSFCPQNRRKVPMDGYLMDEMAGVPQSL